MCKKIPQQEVEGFEAKIAMGSIVSEPVASRNNFKKRQTKNNKPKNTPFAKKSNLKKKKPTHFSSKKTQKNKKYSSAKKSFSH